MAKPRYVSLYYLYAEGFSGKHFPTKGGALDYAKAQSLGAAVVERIHVPVDRSGLSTYLNMMGAE